MLSEKITRNYFPTRYSPKHCSFSVCNVFTNCPSAFRLLRQNIRDEWNDFKTKKEMTSEVHAGTSQISRESEGFTASSRPILSSTPQTAEKLDGHESSVPELRVFCIDLHLFVKCSYFLHVKAFKALFPENFLANYCEPCSKV